MFCTKCGKDLPEGSKFCTSCGSEVKGASTPVEGALPTASPTAGIYPTVLTAARSKKSRWPLIAGSGLALLLVLAIVLVLALVVFKGEKTLSKKDYRLKAINIQDATIDSLKNLEKGLSDLDKTNSSLSTLSDTHSLLVELSQDLNKATVQLEDGASQLESLKPPSEAKSLNQDLVTFHRENGEKLNGFKSSITYSENLTQALASVDFSKFQDEINKASGNVQQLIEVLTKQKSLIGNLVGKLNAITPPEDWKKTHQDFIALWEEMEKIYGELIAALQTMDLARAEKAESQASALQSRSNDILEIYNNGFKDIQNQVKAIIQKAESLRNQIDALR